MDIVHLFVSFNILSTDNVFSRELHQIPVA